jgi:HD-like signal output (HDOD) protein
VRIGGRARKGRLHRRIVAFRLENLIAAADVLGQGRHPSPYPCAQRAEAARRRPDRTPESALSEAHQSRLEQWIARLAEQDMPILAHTVLEVTRVCEAPHASAADLATVILRDPALTARLLRLVNSVFYNPQQRRLNTVSRAVVVLGFDKVRTLCLSIGVLDALLARREGREATLREVARAFHAAVQARELAALSGERDPEEVFVAALLYRLGHLAVRCFAPEEASRMDRLAAQGAAEAAEREVLGFRLDQLTASLSREWHLSALLDDTLAGRGGDAGRLVSEVQRVAEVAGQGWESPEARAVVEDLAGLLDRPPQGVLRLLREAAEGAARAAQAFGLNGAARWIAPGEEAQERLPASPETPPAAPAYPKPDGELERQVLTELAGMLRGHTDVNLVLSTVLEGLYRGAGLDRVLFALLSADRRRLRVKHAIGWVRFDAMRDALARADLRRPGILARTLAAGEPVWLRPPLAPAVDALVDPELRTLSEGAPCLLAPVTVGKQAVGLLYVDRHPSGRALDPAARASLEGFARVTAAALAKGGRERRRA